MTDKDTYDLVIRGGGVIRGLLNYSFEAEHIIMAALGNQADAIGVTALAPHRFHSVN